MTNNNVLFMSAPIGAGHIRAAQAVSQMLKITNPACKTELCNVFDFFHPAIGQTILKSYLRLLDIFPQAYGSMYSWGNQSQMALLGRDLISRLLARRMANYICNFQPSVIVCTHATPAGLVAWCKKNGLLTVPAIGIITDFVIHRLWVYPEFDHYFVAHTGMVEYLSKYGIAHKSVTVSGIPISLAFSQPIDSSQVLRNLNLSQDRKTILLMGGGAGVLPMDRILEMCMEIDKPLQFITIAGNNRQLYRKLMRMATSSKHPVRVLGYIDNVHEIMSAVDLLISKPGGMTVSEALALGVPLIIYRPIPGQEEANTSYLLARRAALRADSLPELKTILQNLMAGEQAELSRLQHQAAALGCPDATKSIAEFLVKKYFY